MKTAGHHSNNTQGSLELPQRRHEPLQKSLKSPQGQLSVFQDYKTSLKSSGTFSETKRSILSFISSGRPQTARWPLGTSERTSTKNQKIKSVFVIPGVVLVRLTCRNYSNAKRALEQSFIWTVWIHAAVDLCPPDQAMHHLTEHTVTSDTHHPEPGSKPKVSIAWALTV